MSKPGSRWTLAELATLNVDPDQVINLIDEREFFGSQYRPNTLDIVPISALVELLTAPFIMQTLDGREAKALPIRVTSEMLQSYIDEIRKITTKEAEERQLSRHTSPELASTAQVNTPESPHSLHSRDSTSSPEETDRPEYHLPADDSSTDSSTGSDEHVVSPEVDVQHCLQYLLQYILNGIKLQLNSVGANSPFDFVRACTLHGTRPGSVGSTQRLPYSATNDGTVVWYDRVKYERVPRSFERVAVAINVEVKRLAATTSALKQGRILAQEMSQLHAILIQTLARTELVGDASFFHLRVWHRSIRVMKVTYPEAYIKSVLEQGSLDPIGPVIRVLGTRLDGEDLEGFKMDNSIHLCRLIPVLIEILAIAHSNETE